MSKFETERDKIEHCINLFMRITGDDDPLESWFNLEKKIKRFGICFVYDHYFELNGYEGNLSNFKWCIAAIIHEYYYGSDHYHMVRAAQWLIADLVHAGQGNFGIFIADEMEPYRIKMLGEFSREIGCYTCFWGLGNKLGEDGAHSVAWIFQQVATANQYIVKNKRKMPISDQSFKFINYSEFGDKNPLIFMDFEDAILFTLAIMVVIKPACLFSEPTSNELVAFIENIYDDYLSCDDLDLLKYYKSVVKNGNRIGFLNGFQFSNSEIYEEYPGRKEIVISALEILIKKIQKKI